MNKNLLAVLILGGTALYLLSRKKCTCEKKNLVNEIHVPESETIAQLGKEVRAQAVVEKLQPALPFFGKPLVIENPTYQNYVDVKKNDFFKPKVGGFFKHE